VKCIDNYALSQFAGIPCKGNTFVCSKAAGGDLGLLNTNSTNPLVIQESQGIVLTHADTFYLFIFLQLKLKTCLARYKILFNSI